LTTSGFIRHVDNVVDGIILVARVYLRLGLPLLTGVVGAGFQAGVASTLAEVEEYPQ
jgi:hypothetical protein